MEGRRRITLYDRMTAGNTTSLADLILHDNVILADQNTDADAAAAAAAAAAATTLATAGSCHLGQSRTLVDILREDERHNNTTDRKSRRAFNFMDKLRLKLTLNSRSNYNSDNNNNNNNHNNLSELQTRIYPDELTQQGTTHQQQNDVVVAVEPENPAEVAVAGPAGVSLMDLLEETDMESGLEVSSHRMSSADYEDVNECEGEEEKGEEEDSGSVERDCCVCMVRHKGAAFIPCGHTFCRTCSREVWVSRGNCPLCNNFILEILDIF